MDAFYNIIACSKQRLLLLALLPFLFLACACAPSVACAYADSADAEAVIKLEQRVVGRAVSPDSEADKFDYVLQPVQGAVFSLMDANAVHAMTNNDVVSAERGEEQWLSFGKAGNASSSLQSGGLGTGVPVLTAGGSIKMRMNRSGATTVTDTDNTPVATQTVVFPALKFSAADLPSEVRLASDALVAASGSSGSALIGNVMYDERFGVWAKAPDTYSDQTTPIPVGKKIGRYIYSITQVNRGDESTQYYPYTEYAQVFVVEQEGSEQPDVQVSYWHDRLCTQWQWVKDSDGTYRLSSAGDVQADSADATTVPASCAPMVNSHKSPLKVRLNWVYAANSSVGVTFKRTWAVTDGKSGDKNAVNVGGEGYSPQHLHLKTGSDGSVVRYARTAVNGNSAVQQWNWEPVPDMALEFPPDLFDGAQSAEACAGTVALVEEYLSAQDRRMTRRYNVYSMEVAAAKTAQNNSLLYQEASDQVCSQVAKRTDTPAGDGIPQATVKNTQAYDGTTAVVGVVKCLYLGGWQDVNQTYGYRLKLAGVGAYDEGGAVSRKPVSGSALTETQVASLTPLGASISAGSAAPSGMKLAFNERGTCFPAVSISHDMLTYTGNRTWKGDFYYKLTEVVPAGAQAWLNVDGVYRRIGVDGTALVESVDEDEDEPSSAQVLTYGAYTTDASVRNTVDGVLGGETAARIVWKDGSAPYDGRAHEVHVAVVQDAAGAYSQHIDYDGIYGDAVDACFTGEDTQSAGNAVQLVATWVDDNGENTNKPLAANEYLKKVSLLRDGTAVEGVNPSVSAEELGSGHAHGDARIRVYTLKWSGLDGALESYTVDQEDVSGYESTEVRYFGVNSSSNEEVAGAAPARTAMFAVTNKSSALTTEQKTVTVTVSGGSGGGGAASAPSPAPAASPAPSVVETVSATATVNWDDDSGIHSTRPNYVELDVVQKTGDGTWKKTGKKLRVTGKDEEVVWRATVEGLPKTSGSANAIYAFDDPAVPSGYTLSGENTTTLSYAYDQHSLGPDDGQPTAAGAVSGADLSLAARLAGGIATMIPASADGADMNVQALWVNKDAKDTLEDTVESVEIVASSASSTASDLQDAFDILLMNFGDYQQAVRNGLVGSIVEVEQAGGIAAYKLGSGKTAALAKVNAKSGSTVSVNTVEAGGIAFKVTSVGAGAFAKSKAEAATLGANVSKIGSGAFSGASKLKTLTVKSKKLTKSSVKGALKGSSVGTVKVKVSSSSSTNKKYIKRYSAYFKKANSGRKVKVR